MEKLLAEVVLILMEWPACVCFAFEMYAQIPCGLCTHIIFIREVDFIMKGQQGINPFVVICTCVLRYLFVPSIQIENTQRACIVIGFRIDPSLASITFSLLICDIHHVFKLSQHMEKSHLTLFT